jgi:hypothetical protein
MKDFAKKEKKKKKKFFSCIMNTGNAFVNTLPYSPDIA